MSKTISVNIDFKDPERTREAIEQIRHSANLVSLAHILEGILCLNEGKFEEARPQIERGISHDSFSPQFYNLITTEVNKLPDDAFSTFWQQLGNDMAQAALSKNIIGNLAAIIDTSGFQKNNSKLKLRVLAEHFIASLINSCYLGNKIDLALQLENLFYSVFINRMETDEDFEFGMSLIKDAAMSAAKSIEKPLTVSTEHSADDIPTIAFFIHNATTLAHIMNIYSVLENNFQNQKNEFRPVIFCFGGRDQNFSALFENIHVPIHYLDTAADGQPINSTLMRLMRCYTLSQQLNVAKFVWVCLAVYMPFAFGMRMAEEQIWWSQKWTKLKLDTIDKYIGHCSFAFKQEKNGVLWHEGWFQKQSWREPINTGELSRIREKYKNSVILGTLSREDKITDPHYLSCVASILKQRPDAVFLWACRNKLAEIEAFFEKEGVADQVESIGWVNTSLYSAAFDVLLDSFPFGNGVTAIQAMEAGVPVVTMKASGSVRTWDLLFNCTDKQSPNTYEQEASSLFSSDPEKADADLYICATTPQEYQNLALKLIDDHHFRHKAGEANKKVVKQLLCNPEQCASIYNTHLLSAV